jgi:hypothetical protein
MLDQKDKLLCHLSLLADLTKLDMVAHTVIPTTWSAVIRGQPAAVSKNSWAWRYMPVIPATGEVELGESQSKAILGKNSGSHLKISKS